MLTTRAEQAKPEEARGRYFPVTLAALGRLRNALSDLWCAYTHGGGHIERDPLGRINWRCRKCGRWSIPVDHPPKGAMMEQDVKAQNTAKHRWSGWPGAWCLDCGCDDPYEVALADGLVDFGPDGETPIIAPEVQAEITAKMACPEPGSKRHDPYACAAIARQLVWSTGTIEGDGLDLIGGNDGYTPDT